MNIIRTGLLISLCCLSVVPILQAKENCDKYHSGIGHELFGPSSAYNRCLERNRLEDEAYERNRQEAKAKDEAERALKAKKSAQEHEEKKAELEEGGYTGCMKVCRATSVFMCVLQAKYDKNQCENEELLGRDQAFLDCKEKC
jgi:hypothetical protein